MGQASDTVHSVSTGTWFLNVGSVVFFPKSQGPNQTTARGTVRWGLPQGRSFLREAEKHTCL